MESTQILPGKLGDCVEHTLLCVSTPATGTVLGGFRRNSVLENQLQFDA